MKKFSEIGAFILVFVVIISAIVIIIVSGNRTTDAHYVCIELNPRIEFLTDEGQNVKSYKPLNQEAKELICEESFVGLKMTDACEKFLTLCARTGYLKPDGNNNAIKISVLSGFNQGLEVNLIKTANNFFVKNNILGVVVESSQDLAQYKAAKKLGISSEKYDLMLAVRENDNTIALENLKEYSNIELIKKIEESHNKYSLDITPEDIGHKKDLLNVYEPLYLNHIEKITNETTRSFKEDLKEFKAKHTKQYKINFEQKYNEWLFG